MPDIVFARSIGPTSFDDGALTGRIATAYRLAQETPLGPDDSMWMQHLREMRQDVHNALLADDLSEAQSLLQNPAETAHFYGYEDLNKISLKEKEALDPTGYAAGEYLGFLALCEALGVRRSYCPENPAAREPDPDVETMLRSIDRVIGVHVTFPNAFPGEIGLRSTRGVISYRAAPAIYQAWRIKSLVQGVAAPRVLEIGGGLGRTAYYAKLLGIIDYTIVDLPLTSAGQASFLGRVLGQDGICLYGETSTTNAIKLIPPVTFLESTDKYDVVINVDSMTEMSREIAVSYCRKIQSQSSVFLSINHECNPFTVPEIFPEPRVARYPYWLRPGYVEELWLPGFSANSGRTLSL